MSEPKTLGAFEAPWSHKRQGLQRRVDEDLVQAVRKDADLHRLYIDRLQTGFPVERLLLAVNTPIIRRVINRYRRFGRDWKDLWQMGRLGVLRACQRYDPEHETTPYTYIYIWVRSYIDRYVRSEAQIVRFPVHLYERTNKSEIKKQFPGLHKLRPQTLVFSETRRELFGGDPLQLDFEDTLVDDVDPVDEQLEKKDIELWCKYIVDKMLTHLPERQQVIIQRRFLGDREPKETLKEIGESFGVSRERIRQLEEEALLSMRRQASVRQCPITPQTQAQGFEQWIGKLAKVDWDAPEFPFIPLPQPEPEPIIWQPPLPRISKKRPKKSRQRVREALGDVLERNRERLQRLNIDAPKKRRVVVEQYDPRPAVVRVNNAEDWLVPCTVRDCEQKVIAMIISGKEKLRFFACQKHVFELSARV
jgi:RNA polymerase sigma factor (sigma-70 family)